MTQDRIAIPHGMICLASVPTNSPSPISAKRSNKCNLLLFQTQRLDFVFDLYGSSCLTGLFVQGNAYDSVYRFERHIVFPKLLAHNCPDFELGNVMYNADVEKAGTSRRLEHRPFFISFQLC